MIGRALFVAKGKLTPNLKLWWHPPTEVTTMAQLTPDTYHHRRLFRWMPREMWKVDFHCPH